MTDHAHELMQGLAARIRAAEDEAHEDARRYEDEGSLRPRQAPDAVRTGTARRVPHERQARLPGGGMSGEGLRD